MSLSPEEITSAEAAFQRGAIFLKFCEAGAKMADDYRALTQLVDQKKLALEILVDDTAKAKGDHTDALEALQATRDETKRLTLDAEQARQEALKGAKAEADAIVAKARDVERDYADKLTALKQETTQFEGLKADLLADLDRLKKEKADFLAKLTG